jgi:hypothetical protein
MFPGVWRIILNLLTTFSNTLCLVNLEVAVLNILGMVMLTFHHLISVP